MRAVLLTSATVLMLALAAPAATQTSITPDTATGLTTGTAISRVGAVTTIAGGTQAGANLFHSFNSFSLGAGEVAAWTASNPTSVANVVNRVTGGGLSTIAGTLDTTALPNADFYFINPAGILFTTGARVAVPNAAHFSTGAGGLRFSDGTTFAALLPGGASFSAAAPESFGFLGQENALVIDGVGFGFLPIGTSLFVAAPNVGINASSFTPLTLDLVATGGEARSVALAHPLGGGPLAGLALLIESQIFATGTGSGLPAIRIGADSLSQSGGFLTSSTAGADDAGDLFIRARAVDITGFIGSNTSGPTTEGSAGTVFIAASDVRISDLGIVSSATLGRGDAGDVVIAADRLLIERGGSIGTDTATAQATGRGGMVELDVGALTVRDEGQISSSTNGPGNAGGVRIRADSVLLDTRGGIGSVTLDGPGDGGFVRIDAGALDIRGEAGISSFSSSAGDAGSIEISADRVSMSGDANIFSQSLLSGAAGNVTIDATTFTLDGGFVVSDTFGPGRAGVISIRAPDLNVRNGFITSESRGAGDAGDIALVATRLSVTEDSFISSSTSKGGAGGQVSIKAGQAQIDFSEVRSQANAGSTGAAGTLLIDVDQLNVTNQTVISSSTLGDGDAGLVSITARDIVLDNSGVLSRTFAPGSGEGGQIQIRTGTLQVNNGGGISSSTSSSGQAGDVLVTAAKVSLDGGGTIESGAALGSTGGGGTVTVTAAESLTLRDGSSLVTSTLGAGDAGQLKIAAGAVSVEDLSLLASRARGAALGAAGSIQVTAGSLQLVRGGQIETSSQNANIAGDIRIALTGPVTVDGRDSRIASENLSATGGAAGAIAIAAARIVLAEGGAISTNATTGAAGDISLFLPLDGLLRLDGRTRASVITTSSGPGTGGRIVISEPLAVISNGGAILALGQAQGANVQIRSDFFIRSSDRVNLLSVDGELVLDSQVSDVSAGVAIPDVSFLDASGVLRGQCPAPRSGGVTSQLSLRAYGPFGAEPEPAPEQVRTSALQVGLAGRAGGCH
ncbi:filamentous hemagglutinin N-terminal domain-containing protein [uncultured Phenylobacterium sp.]|uniref:beta strand repeat-containing protein n=1 Tax=uncultured Phenylobacterium sp. TaxID=349273 RepID=UPI0025E96225|nr:filamentous hemagglutinin N-terminal domain-containing protein [uncultured Phenylobacterium sp.]